jgi:hypothetical protein
MRELSAKQDSSKKQNERNKNQQNNYKKYPAKT